MRIWFLLIIITIFSVSCGHNKGEKKLLSQKDIVPLLIDMHIADALSMNNAINSQFKDLDSSMIYSSVLKKHSCTKDKLIKSLTYFSSKPLIIKEIYDQVFSALSKQAEEAKILRNKYSTSNTTNVWRAKNSRIIITSRDSLYPPAFEFPIDSMGIYVLSVSIKMTDKDSSVNPVITAYFFSQENDNPEHRQYFSKTYIPKSKYSREYTLVEECKDSAFTHMRLIIPEYDNIDSSFYKQINILNLRVGKLKDEAHLQKSVRNYDNLPF